MIHLLKLIYFLPTYKSDSANLLASAEIPLVFTPGILIVIALEIKNVGRYSVVCVPPPSKTEVYILWSRPQYKINWALA